MREFDLSMRVFVLLERRARQCAVRRCWSAGLYSICILALALTCAISVLWFGMLFFCWLSCQATGLYIKSLRVLDWGMVEYIFSIYKFALNDGEIRWGSCTYIDFRNANAIGECVWIKQSRRWSSVNSGIRAFRLIERIYLREKMPDDYFFILICNG